MPERIMPGLGLRAFYDPGQRNWGTSLSEDLRRLSALVQARATSRNTPLPATGSAGQIVIVPATAGANANAVALWDEVAGAAAWVFLPPQDGWQVWIADEARHVRFTAGAWVEVPRPGVARIRTLTATSHPHCATLRSDRCLHPCHHDHWLWPIPTMSRPPRTPRPGSGRLGRKPARAVRSRCPFRVR